MYNKDKHKKLIEETPIKVRHFLHHFKISRCSSTSKVKKGKSYDEIKDRKGKMSRAKQLLKGKKYELSQRIKAERQ